MDMSIEQCLEYEAMKEQGDAIKYADIEPCDYETPCPHSNGYREQGTVAMTTSDGFIKCRDVSQLDLTMLRLEASFSCLQGSKDPPFSEFCTVQCSKGSAVF